MLPVNRSPFQLSLSAASPLLALTLAVTLTFTLAGCSSIENFVSGDKIDYRTSGAKTSGLDVPPDLSQLARDSRYQSQGGSVSAAAFQSGAPGVSAAATTSSVAVRAIGGFWDRTVMLGRPH